MIVPMYKYEILVFHNEYSDFLEKLREMGILNVEKKASELTDEIRNKYTQISLLEKTIQFLEKREIPLKEDILLGKDGLEVMKGIIERQETLESLKEEYYEIQKEIHKAKPLGDFNHQIIEELKTSGIQIKLFQTSRKKYNEIYKNNYPVDIISETGNQICFILINIGSDKYELDEDSIKIPDISYGKLKEKLELTENEITNIEKQLDTYAAESIPALEESKIKLLKSIDFESVIMNTSKEVEDKLMKLDGWIPNTQKAEIENFLEKSKAIYFSRKAKPDDNIPVLLKNNKFSSLFEPIGKMFSLPDYNELDLTVFFAPFFMLFFGFCLGDAGYGLLFLVGAGIYKFKASKSAKPYLSLIQFLGLATIIFGSISGTFFGINLIETEIEWMESFKGLFLNPDKMFNLALVLGAVQIIFGLFIKAANQTKQFGFSYALSTIGWLIVLLGSVVYFLLVQLELIEKNDMILNIVLAIGGFFILFFSDPGINVFSRIGKGMWDIYSTVTGIFGDLLSYIRLFALGLSSAILGFVINDIALQILGSSKILGPVFFVIFLLLGHTLNILISSLGSFVHPMRLTFVEFYKNAGFKGGGEEYKPFTK